MKSDPMKSSLKSLALFCVLCASVVRAFSLDREAFTFTSYDLNVQVEPEQHRLGVRGKITLRNDSQTPQKIAVLQISSSLDWRSIKAGDKAVQFVTQPYTSDIDHTGGLSEAIVTLPQAVAPKGTIDLDIGYEGVIVLDATRLTRIGTPADAAESTDWDQISTAFSAVRGAGYVAWYPIATESASLSEGNDLFEVLGRWKTREAGSEMSLFLQSTQETTILFSGTPNGFIVTPEKGIVRVAAFSMIRPGTNVPTFVLANYGKLDIKGISSVYFLQGKDVAAAAYADILGGLDPLPGARGSRRLQVAELPDPSMAPFVSDSMLLTPVTPNPAEPERLALVYALARQGIPSPHPWINEGLAHFAQVLDMERQHGRKAALDYLNLHRALLVESEKNLPLSEGSGSNSSALINMTDEVHAQSKAMWVWWMLHDMLGDAGLSLVLFNYNALDDKETSYMPRLIAAHSKRDLGWFFDDWVYRDRGLPDFKVESAFSRKAMPNAFIVTITVDNLGTAGAEVPLMVKFAGGVVTKRLEVRAKNRATIRVEVPAAPQEIVVNDGSVPESDLTNNVFKIEASAVAK